MTDTTLPDVSEAPHLDDKNPSPGHGGVLSAAGRHWLKVLYLVATQRRKNRENMTGKIRGWKQLLNALTARYGDRITANH
jgi:hypothetical protein